MLQVYIYIVTIITYYILYRSICSQVYVYIVTIIFTIIHLYDGFHKFMMENPQRNG